MEANSGTIYKMSGTIYKLYQSISMMKKDEIQSGKDCFYNQRRHSEGADHGSGLFRKSAIFFNPNGCSNDGMIIGSFDKKLSQGGITPIHTPKGY